MCLKTYLRGGKKLDIPKIPFLENSLSYVLISEGFSTDVKLCLDVRYLLRVSPTTDLTQLEKQAHFNK